MERDEQGVIKCRNALEELKTNYETYKSQYEANKGPIHEVLDPFTPKDDQEKASDLNSQDVLQESPQRALSRERSQRAVTRDVSADYYGNTMTQDDILDSQQFQEKSLRDIEEKNKVIDKEQKFFSAQQANRQPNDVQMREATGRTHTEIAEASVKSAQKSENSGHLVKKFVDRTGDWITAIPKVFLNVPLSIAGKQVYTIFPDRDYGSTVEGVAGQYAPEISRSVQVEAPLNISEEAIFPRSVRRQLPVTDATQQGRNYADYVNSEIEARKLREQLRKQAHQHNLKEMRRNAEEQDMLNHYRSRTGRHTGRGGMSQRLLSEIHPSASEPSFASRGLLQEQSSQIQAQRLEQPSTSLTGTDTARLENSTNVETALLPPVGLEG